MFFAQWITSLENVEGVIQGIEQMVPGQIIFIEVVDCFERDAGERNKIACGLVDLYHLTLLHE